ncbi:outer membrane protein assembly factor BamB [Kribbella amoyensis]|uniref:Outer membrane protein assembly factor BamB n=1 Tax=Kribbella amoyensis TaxID=996641 RepID=A0A561BQ59_9ACTN|nr:PQQ-binding-like beta-propeller repeat protein [Kribbella amoyensis]TWD81000.1 outer membrane protein assembly factor BamB [Kribbella amoyensis]
MPRRLLSTFTAAGLIGVLAVGSASVPAPAGAEVDAVTITEIGEPVHNLAVYGAAFGPRPDGGSNAYIVARGNPGALSVVDAGTATVTATYELPGASGSWGGVAVDDGTAYIPADAKLFRYRPGSDHVEDLGIPLAGETTAWRAATDGRRVFVGTYPGGKLYSYDHNTGKIRDYGQVLPGEQYARSVAVAGDKVYVGLGTVAKLAEVDIRTGARREIPLPEKYRTETFVYDVNAARGHLIARTANANRMLVYDLGSDTWEADLGTGKGVDASPADPDGNVYYVAGDGKLTAYNLRTGELRPTTRTGMGTARGFGWATVDDPAYPGKTLVTADFSGNLTYYNPRTGASKVASTKLPGRPTQLQTIHAGPDGRIYASSYPSGGMSIYDPATATISENSVLGQVEGFGNWNNKLYAGVYPGAHLFEFDPSKPVQRGTNPREFAALTSDHQDRPFAIAGAGDRLAVGTIPDYGQLGGALTLVDPATGAKEVHRNVVPDQSVTALTTYDGLVYGGTGIWGGLGSTPTQTEGKLFAFDPATGTKVWEGVPIPGEKAITGLIVGPDGHLWGGTVGKLFEFDPVTRTVLRTIDVTPFDWNVDHVWRSVHLAFAPDGSLCGNFRFTIACVDPATGAVDTLVTDADDVWTMGTDGTIYFGRGATMYRLVRG